MGEIRHLVSRQHEEAAVAMGFEHGQFAGLAKHATVSLLDVVELYIFLDPSS